MQNEFKALAAPDERIDEINERLCLIQKKGGLTFGTDAYLLAAFAKKSPRSVAYDLGCGTGVISLLCMARGKYKKIYGVEVQKEFAHLAEKNVRLNGFDSSIEIIEGDVRDYSTFPCLSEAGCVISNPPYMPRGSGKEPDDSQMNIARREENGTIYDFCKSAFALLKHGGLFYTVYRPDRSCELIHALRENSLEPKRMVYIYPDINSPPCLILTEAKKGAAPSVRLSRPLIIYSGTEKSGKRKYTEDMDRIYNEFSLEFLFSK